MKKISARNQLAGRVVEVRKGQTTAHVKVDIGNGVIVTASITNEAADDLQMSANELCSRGDGRRPHCEKPLDCRHRPTYT